MTGLQSSIQLSDNSPVQCPFHRTGGTVNGLPIKPRSILNKINYLGMKSFGKWWLFQYVGSLYPGVLAHFSEGSLYNRLLGKNTIFNAASEETNKTFFEYFEASDINEFAKKHGGICTFRMGTEQSIYQISNFPLAKDKWLEPSQQDRSTGIFGEFLGTMDVNSKRRKMKRAVIESVLGNWSFLHNQKKEVKKNIEQLLTNREQKELSLKRFCQEVVADNASLISGIFDFKEKPLSHYFVEFEGETVSYFEMVSGLYSGHHKDPDAVLARMELFVKTVLKDNYSVIKSAPETNVIKRYFQIWNLPFTLQAIEELDSAYLRDLGTTMINTFETTSLSLSWVISYVENNPLIKQRIMNEIKEESKKECTYIDLVILEAIRLAGSNPTVMLRIAAKKFDVKIGKNKIIVLPGTKLWLNRREANQDNTIFQNPTQFDPNNIKCIMNSKNDDIKSIVSKNRYEINSFNMINTEDSPRKCPARLYSIYTQSLIIRALYQHYQVILKNNNPEFNPNAPMPEPMSLGTIQITRKS